MRKREEFAHTSSTDMIVERREAERKTFHQIHAFVEIGDGPVTELELLVPWNA